ncbi:hypothetical protein HY212_07915 [Candidatus Pacearchaeota archaeon]|nr:hypothetical protein [Candidatus Pacearchaeota archaeon]
MPEEYSALNIRHRLVKIRKDAGEPNRRLTVLSRMAYEFGTPENLYNSNMSDDEIVEVTLNCQVNPSPLEVEMEKEVVQYL